MRQLRVWPVISTVKGLDIEKRAFHFEVDVQELKEHCTVF